VPRGLILFILSLSAAILGVAATPPVAPVLKGDDSSYDFNTGEGVVRGHARLEAGTLLLEADEIRLNQKTQEVSALGHFTITDGRRRILAERGTYNLTTEVFTLAGLRAGEPPVYVVAAKASGTRSRIVLTDAVVSYGEPGPLSPTLKAAELVYEPGKRITGEHARIGLGGTGIIALTRIDRPLDETFISNVSTRLGYRSNLGAYVDCGLHIPVVNGLSLGADLGIYTARGIMFGPTGTYRGQNADTTFAGEFRSGFINDHGDKQTDLLGRAVPEERGYVSWEHRQTIGENITVAGQLNWWKDSEILRDFHPNQFYPVQQPDSYMEAVYSGDDYLVDLFSRLSPNNFQRVQERLPELRFDLAPRPVGAGFYARLSSSIAILRDDPPAGGTVLRSNRFDTFFSIERPITPSDWLTLTPVAGGRVTHYAKTTGGRATYTRWLGEVGLDAELRSAGTFSYRNPLWQIDGLRHLLTPKISYRYIPDADQGSQYIPAIDRRVFSTDLEPLELGATRNIDDLHGLHVMRVGLDNVLQTRDRGYGSRSLFTWNVAADLRVAREAGQDRWSDIYNELALTPADWLRFELFQRFSPQRLTLRELNTGLQLINHEWWTIRLYTNYLQHELHEYYAEYDHKVDEIWKGFVRTRYDVRASRWDEVTIGVHQNLRNTWNLRYEVSWYQGRQREGSFGFGVAVDLLRF